jgi:hypothetical protein
MRLTIGPLSAQASSHWRICGASSFGNPTCSSARPIGSGSSPWRRQPKRRQAGVPWPTRGGFASHQLRCVVRSPLASALGSSGGAGK